jgi:hypothetical protein
MTYDAILYILAALTIAGMYGVALFYRPKSRRS